MYCSKDHQKAAWPTHKPYCQRVERDTDLLASLNHETQRRFGYESTLALSQAFREYMDAHHWAIQDMIRAHILLRSGPSMAIGRQEPRTDVLRIRLVCQTTPGARRSQRNPATTFKVVDHGFWPLAYYATGAERNVRIRAEMLKESQKCHEDNLRSSRNSCNYVGILPIMYIVDGSPIQQFDMFPVVRPPPNNINIDANMKTVLSDLTRYCAYSLGTAFTLRAISERLPYCSVPGRYIRSKGKEWMWEALFNDWADYHDGRTSCERLPGLEELGLAYSPAALMNLYATFWAMEAPPVEKRGISALLTL